MNHTSSSTRPASEDLAWRTERLRLGATLGALAAALASLVFDGPEWLTLLLATGCVWLAAGIPTARIRRSLRELTQHAESLAGGVPRGARPPIECPETARLARAVERLVERHDSQQGQSEAELDDLRRALEVIGHALIVVDAHHRLLRANAIAQSLFHLQDGSWRGRVVEECVREPAVHDLVRRCLKGGEVAPTELRLGDAARIYMAAAEPLRGPSGPHGALLVFDDITRLKRLEALRTDFAANVSHELRTPITSIRGYAETLLTTDSLDPAQSKRFIEVIARNAHRLATLIEDILTLSFLESPASQRTLEMSTVPLPAVIAEVTSTLQPTADAKDVRLVHQCDPLLVTNGNETLLTQALANLVSNAIKFSPRGGAVTIQAREDAAAGVIELTVRDEGPGIGAEHLPRIFERFYRVDAARSRELGGTGLGLAIVKHIAKVHGGDVTATSRPGAGSTFSLRLPTNAPRSW